MQVLKCGDEGSNEGFVVTSVEVKFCGGRKGKAG